VWVLLLMAQYIPDGSICFVCKKEIHEGDNVSAIGLKPDYAHEKCMKKIL
jgi:hypothetical protein